MKHILTVALVSAFIVSITLFTASNVVAQTNEHSVVNTYAEIKEGYQNTLSEYRSTRSDFLSARNKYRKKSAAISSEQLLELARKYVQKTVITMSKYLETLKIRVENAGSIDEEKRNTIIVEIDSDIAWLQERLEQIENTSESSALTSITNSIREQWASIKIRAKKYVGVLLATRTYQTIDKLEQEKNKVEKYIVQLQENNQEVGRLEGLLEEFDEKLEMTKTQTTSAEGVFNRIDSSENMQLFFKQGKDFLTSANRYIRETWQVYQASVSELKKRRLYNQ
ncbi:hypothetical protein KKB10_05470 [Patescibacteria group bacterium]|nr:hypothetical protein [Patescibacteria group bacterium]MBU1075357.1 hypothetical protein [Patescibacteria group bacterium]MBU1951710.1 hypothetical protein [Patescibacteria group bacterium]